jgi:hypothetical protein
MLVDFDTRYGGWNQSTSACSASRAICGRGCAHQILLRVPSATVLARAHCAWLSFDANDVAALFTEDVVYRCPSVTT